MILTLVAGACTLACQVVHASAPDPRDAPDLPTLIARAKPAVVTVITTNKAGAPVAQGSGFFVAPGIVLTCSHVLDGAFHAKVILHDRSELAVSLVMQENEDADLAILGVGRIDKDGVLRIEGNQVVLPLALGLPKEGARIVVLGTPKGLEQSAADGIVSAVRPDAPIAERIQISAPISAGSSGSPVLTMNGEACGVAVSTLKSGQNLNFAVPASLFVEVLPKPTPNANGAIGQSPEARWNKVAVEQFRAARKVIIEAEARDSARRRDQDAFGESDRAKEHAQLAAATRQVERASRFAPDDAEIWEYLGRARKETSHETLELAAKTSAPVDGDAFRRDAEAVVAAFERAVALDRDRREVWKELREWYIWAGRRLDGEIAEQEEKLVWFRRVTEGSQKYPGVVTAEIRAELQSQKTAIERRIDELRKEKEGR